MTANFVQRWLMVIFAVAFLFNDAWAARRPSYEENQSVVLREILDSVDDMRHEVKNHETEIRMFEEKFKTQEEIIDALRQQVAEAVKAVKESIKSQSSALEMKLANQEKTQANDVGMILADYKKRIGELEKTIEIQNRNLENLQAAMKALTEVLQGKNSGGNDKIAEGTIYRVKAGDTLEKIAKNNNTTIKKLKELNNLKNDQIIVGQKLQLAE
jgi:LysM repeat protein